MVGGCAAPRHPFEGAWRYDAVQTTKLLDAHGVAGGAHLARHLYQPQRLVITGQRYTMTWEGAAVSGRFIARKVSGQTWRVKMSCPRTREGDSGLATLTGWGWYYATSDPMFKGDSMAYTPVPSAK